MLPEGTIRNAAAVFGAGVGAAVSTVLGFGGLRLLQAHKDVGKPIALGIPVWVADLAFPIAFGLIALRLVWKSSVSYAGRGVAALGIGAGVLLWLRPDLLDGVSAWPGIVVLIVAAVCGMPIFGLLGGCAVFLFLAQGDSPASALIGSYDQLTSEGLAAIPLFTLAGYLLAEGRASDRLFRLFRAFFGWMPGGTAIVTATLCAFFTVFTGGSGVTILALGGLLLPTLLADGYRPKFSLGLLTAAGSLGLLFPPALPLILYGIVAGVSIGNLFIGGLLPGLIMLAFLSALGIREGLAAGTARSRFARREAAAAFWQAKWELLMPVVILGSLLLGATTVQSAALAALFALIVQRFIHRDLASFGEVRRVMSDSISLVGGVLIILAVAVGFTNYLIDAQVPAHMIEWAEGHIHSARHVPAGAERLPADRRLPHGHLFGYRRGRAAHGADRGSFRDRSRPSGHHLHRQPGTGLPHAAGRPEPVPVVVPVQQAGARDRARHVPDAGRAGGGGTADHLCALAHDRHGGVAGNAVGSQGPSASSM